MKIELSDVKQVILDSNAEYVMSEEFEASEIDSIIKVMAKALQVSEDKARQLLSRRVKEIQAQQISGILELLKPQTKPRKNKKSESEEPVEHEEAKDVKVTSFIERQVQQQEECVSNES